MYIWCPSSGVAVETTVHRPNQREVCESPLSFLYTLFGQKPHSHHVQCSTDNKYFTNGPKTFFQTINDCIHCSEGSVDFSGRSEMNY